MQTRTIKMNRKGTNRKGTNRKGKRQSRVKRRHTIRKGGMHRAAMSAAKSVFKEAIKGKNPVERIDKAKDIVNAVLEGVKSQQTPVKIAKSVVAPLTFSPKETPRLSPTCKTPKSNDLCMSYRTPVKGKVHNIADDDDDDDAMSAPGIPKIRRHRSTLTPQSYAPTLDNPSSVVTGKLIE